MEEVASDEHIIRCNTCGRGLIVKDNVNNGVAFLSHLKNDHGIFYTAQQQMATEAKKKKRDNTPNNHKLAPPE